MDSSDEEIGVITKKKQILVDSDDEGEIPPLKINEKVEESPRLMLESSSEDEIEKPAQEVKKSKKKAKRAMFQDDSSDDENSEIKESKINNSKIDSSDDSGTEELKKSNKRRCI